MIQLAKALPGLTLERGELLRKVLMHVCVNTVCNRELQLIKVI